MILIFFLFHHNVGDSSRLIVPPLKIHRNKNTKYRGALVRFVFGDYDYNRLKFFPPFRKWYFRWGNEKYRGHKKKPFTVSRLYFLYLEYFHNENRKGEYLELLASKIRIMSPVLRIEGEILSFEFQITSECFGDCLSCIDRKVWWNGLNIIKKIHRKLYQT